MSEKFKWILIKTLKFLKEYKLGPHGFRKWLGKICRSSEFYHCLRAPSLISSKISRCCPNTKAKAMLISSFPECEINRFSPTWCILLHYELGWVEEFLSSHCKEKQLYGILSTNPMKPGIMPMRLAKRLFPTSQREMGELPRLQRWVSWWRNEKRESNIIIGSICATYEEKPWMFKLYEMIRRIVGRNGVQKLLGFCFWHQSIAETLGGKVERMKNLEFDVMLMYKNRIYMKQEFLNTSFLKNSLAFKRIIVTRGIYLNQAHGNYVKERLKYAIHYG